MSNIISELLTFLCTGLGEGNTNTDKLTNQILLLNPGMDYNTTKIQVVEAIAKRNRTNSDYHNRLGTGTRIFLYLCKEIIKR